MQLGEIIGRGRTADTYRYGPWAFKWLHARPSHRGELLQEVRKALVASRAGAPSPRPLAVLEHEGRAGILFERVGGQTMQTLVMHRLWQAGAFGRELASLHASLHNAPLDPVESNDLPSTHQRLHAAIAQNNRLDSAIQSVVLRLLDALPQGQALCHGDFHPGNVLFQGEKAVIVDWVDASIGNPLADVARTQMLFQIPRLPFGGLQAAIIQSLRAHMLRTYLREYFRLRPGGRQELQDWLTVIMAARLAENIQNEERELIRRLGQRLA